MSGALRFTIIIPASKHDAVQAIADFRGPEAYGMFPVFLTRIADGVACRSTPRAGAIDSEPTYSAFGDHPALLADLQSYHDDPIPLTVAQIDDAFAGAVVLDYPMDYWETDETKSLDDDEYFAALGYRFDGVAT